MKEANLYSAIYNRHSVRSFKPDPISDEDLHLILNCARWAPSGGNGQNWSFGVVKDQETRLELAKAAGEQMWIAEAPVVLAMCAQLVIEESSFSRQVNELRWGKGAVDWLYTTPKPEYRALLFGNGTPAIPGAHIQLVAHSLGLGTCWIGYLDINRASEALELPTDWKCYFLIPLGCPTEATKPLERSRKPLTEVTFAEKWTQELVLDK